MLLIYLFFFFTSHSRKIFYFFFFSIFVATACMSLKTERRAYYYIITNTRTLIHPPRPQMRFSCSFARPFSVPSGIHLFLQHASPHAILGTRTPVRVFIKNEKKPVGDVQRPLQSTRRYIVLGFFRSESSGKSLHQKKKNNSYQSQTIILWFI